MADKPINLNDHRGKDERRFARLRLRQVRKLTSEQKDKTKAQDRIEDVLISTLGETWPEVGPHALYLIRVLADNSKAVSTKRQVLIEQTVGALEALCSDET